MNEFVDPNRGQESPKKIMHLKMIAACHLLPNYATMSCDDIDKFFGVDVQQLSDFRYLDGTIFKVLFVNYMSQAPKIDNFKYGFPQNDEGHDEQVLDSNNSRILRGWNNVYGKCVVEIYKE